MSPITFNICLYISVEGDIDIDIHIHIHIHILYNDYVWSTLSADQKWEEWEKRLLRLLEELKQHIEMAD